MQKLGRKRLILIAAVLATFALAACGGDDGASNDNTPEGSLEDASITVYSGRDEEMVGPILEAFEEAEGVEVEVRYGDSAELAATILEEGDASPADVFFSQDAGSLGAVSEAGLFEPISDEVLDRVDPRFSASDGTWVGTSGRARVAVYNTDSVDASELPDSILGFTEPEWKGRIGFPPTNSSFQAFVAAMIITEGEGETRSFLEGLVANEPKLYEDNSSTVRGAAAGEIDAGFVNHYYIFEVAAEDGEIPAANHFFTGGDPGALVNTAGVGVLASSEAKDAAAALVDYLTREEGQTFFAEDTFEYPVADGFEPGEDLVPLDEIQSPEVDLSDLGGALEPALTLLAEVGLL